MRTEATLYKEFAKPQHNWQSKKLQEVELDEVLQNLLKHKFVVEINGSKYDISFGAKRGKIGWGWSSSPSPHLTSSEIIEKAFREGKWFVVMEDDLI